MNESDKLRKIKARGTIKEKALFVCKEHFELKFMEQEPHITFDEAASVLAEIDSKKGREEFIHWTDIYDIYKKQVDPYKETYMPYDRMAMQVLIYLKMWEGYDRMTDIINNLADAAAEQGKEAERAFEEAMERTHPLYACIERDKKDGSYLIDVIAKNKHIQTLYNIITQAVDMAMPSFGSVKAYTMAIEQFAKRTDSEEFIPAPLKETMGKVKDISLYIGIPSNFTRKYLMERKAKGYKISAAEKIKAVYPDYSEIKENKAELKMHTDEINRLYEKHKTKL